MLFHDWQNPFTSCNKYELLLFEKQKKFQNLRRTQTLLVIYLMHCQILGVNVAEIYILFLPVIKKFTLIESVVN